MFGNTTMGTSKTSICKSSVHEEQQHLDGLRTQSLAKKLGLRILDGTDGTNGTNGTNDNG